MRERQALEFSPVQAPAEGVSPQTDRCLHEWKTGTGPRCVKCGVDSIVLQSPVSPVEPTPEPPTGEAAPCVWRKAPRDRVLPGCKPERWFDRLWVLDFTHCPYCGHPLTVER